MVFSTTQNTQYSHEYFMQKALTLAAKGEGSVSPNPMVGCVIVKNNKIIAQGYHKKFGGDHAEVVALKKIHFNAKGATLYVSLEPCHHQGKTPPCVDAVIRSNVSHVVIAMQDPNPLTKGKSIRKLKKAGIQVTLGVCEKQAKDLNRFFIKRMQTGLPYTIVKVAQSLDGMISTQKGKQGWITGKESKEYVQGLRQKVDAVLIGRSTLQIDNPQLNVRNKKYSQPKRVILDSSLKTKLNKKLKIFSSHGGEVIFVCALKKNDKRVTKFQNFGVTVLCVHNCHGKVSLKSALTHLAKSGINLILIEGGAKIFTEFYQTKLADEWQFLIAPKVVGTKGYPAFTNETKFNKFTSIQFLGNDILGVIQ